MTEQPQPLPPPELPDSLTLEAHERELLRRLTNHYLAEPKPTDTGPEAAELHAYTYLPWLRARDALAAELGASLVDRLTIEYRIYLDPGY
jgi:hypothetical protein